MSDCQSKSSTKRITNIMREKSTRRPFNFSSIQCCPEIHWNLPRLDTITMGLTLQRDPLDKCLYTDPKLGQKVLEKKILEILLEIKYFSNFINYINIKIFFTEICIFLGMKSD